MPERLVRQPSGHSVTQDALDPALPAPRIHLYDPALDNRAARFESLPDGLQAELIKLAERGQIRRSKGSVEHVEVFRAVSVRTSILEDLDTYPPAATPTPTTLSTTKSLFGWWSACFACGLIADISLSISKLCFVCAKG